MHEVRVYTPDGKLKRTTTTDELKAREDELFKRSAKDYYRQGKRKPKKEVGK